MALQADFFMEVASIAKDCFWSEFCLKMEFILVLTGVYFWLGGLYTSLYFLLGKELLKVSLLSVPSSSCRVRDLGLLELWGWP